MNKILKKIRKSDILTNKVNFVLTVLLLLICILFSNYLWHGDVLFHTDLARDFLVLEEIIETKNPTLIGPRSGGIPGVFHGPLWYYISLLPFLITGGDPVLMGWFWWTLAVAATFSFFYILQNITKNTFTSLLLTIAFALQIIPGAASPVNNFLADLCSFVVFVVWYLWFQNKKWQVAALGWFGLGLLVQFQMAFAAPMAIVLGVIFFAKVVHGKLWKQLFTIGAFFPPLASFVLFDLRHDWLQVRSVLQYVQSSTSEIQFSDLVTKRINIALQGGLNVFGLPGYFNAGLAGLVGYLGWRTKERSVRLLILLFLSWFVGWWVVTLVFSGEVWSYYYTPFYGILLFCMGVIATKSKYVRVALIVALLFSIPQRQGALMYNPERFNSSSWSLLQEIAADALSEPGRGYFLYSQDQYAYTLKYAFKWHQKSHPDSNAFAFEKKEHVVLVKAKDDPGNPFMTADYWQNHLINISEEPHYVQKYPFDYTLELYTLDDEAIAKPIDENLILDLHFR